VGVAVGLVGVDAGDVYGGCYAGVVRLVFIDVKSGVEVPEVAADGADDEVLDLEVDVGVGLVGRGSRCWQRFSVGLSWASLP